MAFPVTMGASLACTFGNAPSTLVVIPKGPPVQMEKKFAANILDFVPMTNIMPFGLCMSIANPMVAAATAAALGTLTPQPCIPATVAPWAPGGPTVLLAKAPILNNSSKLMCTWAGVISVVNPGTTTETCP